MCVICLLYYKMGGEAWVLPVENFDSEGTAYRDYTKYAMRFTKLSNKACLSAAQINWATKQKSDVFKMIINSGTGKELVVDLPYNKQEGSVLFPVLVNDVIKSCDNDDNNQIDWVFF